MIDREHERLLHEVLEGSASPADAARLEAWLATSAEGRQRRSELEALFSALAAVPRVPPPPSLRSGVLDGIRSRSRSVPVPARRLLAPAWLLVPAAAAAIAVAIAFPRWRQALSPEAMPDVSGSLAARPSTVAPTILAIGEASVTLARTDAGGATSVSLETANATPIVIELESDPATLARAEVRGLPETAIRRDAANGRLELAPHGTLRFSLEFRPALRREESVKVTIRTGERRVAGVLPQPREEP
jgi:hypothetical protein